jgi:hypothetical protein
VKFELLSIFEVLEEGVGEVGSNLSILCTLLTTALGSKVNFIVKIKVY